MYLRIWMAMGLLAVAACATSATPKAGGGAPVSTGPEGEGEAALASRAEKATSAEAYESHPDEGGAAHHGAHGEGHDGGDGPLVHRFTDPEAYAARWESPERAEWQKPGELVSAMGLEAGMVVADIGAGTGYFLPYLQGAVGPTGRVFAVDIEAEMLAYIQARIESEGWPSVQTVQATVDGPNLAAASLDRVLIVDTWHHISHRGAYAAELKALLKPEGQIYIVDFTMETQKGPGKHHRLTPETVIAELEAGGLRAWLMEESLPDQFVVVAASDEAAAPENEPRALTGVIHYTPIDSGVMSVDAYMGVSFNLETPSGMVPLDTSDRVASEALAALDGEMVYLECVPKPPVPSDPMVAAPVGLDGEPLPRPVLCEVTLVEAMEAGGG